MRARAGAWLAQSRGTPRCIDTSSDTAHCGSCTRSCGGGQSCVASDCVCPAGRTLCRGYCADTTTDHYNCGTCGVQCTFPADACVAGACSCGGGRALCGSQCVWTTTDPRNCGACGASCAGGACAAGVCTCPAGTTRCADGCVVLDTTATDCGACGHACEPGAGCVGGACVCPGGWIECGGACVDPMRDGANCGACGASCAAGLCVNGGCHRPIAIGGWYYDGWALTDGGAVLRWGFSSRPTAPPVVQPITGAIQLASRGACAVRADGSLSCDTRVTNAVEVQIGGGLGGGSRLTCVVHADRTVSCWGDNSYGQAGQVSPPSIATPTLVAGLAGAQHLALGDYFACALRVDRTVACWGRNDYGQLGDGTSANRATPSRVSGVSDVVALAAGARHACAVTSTGTSLCWGDNGYGQLGLGVYTGTILIATAVPAMTSATSVAAGAEHTCWALSSGALRCAGAYATDRDWGTRWANAMPAVRGVVFVGTGWMSTYVIDASGVAWGFGTNSFRALTLPDSTTSTATPTRLVWH